MPSEPEHPHRRQKGPPADKREALEEQGVAKKADQGQKHWDKLGLQELKAWEEVLPLWQQLQWYKYTGAQKGGALFALWPDSEQWGTDVWTANVPPTIKELAMRQGLSASDVSSSLWDPAAPEQSARHQSVSEHLQPATMGTRSMSAATRSTSTAPVSPHTLPSQEGVPQPRSTVQGPANLHACPSSANPALPSCTAQLQPAVEHAAAGVNAAPLNLPVHTVPELPSGAGTTLETLTTTAFKTAELPTTLDAGTGPGALDHTTATLLMTLGKGGDREQGQKSPFQNADQTDEALEPGAQLGFPRFLCKLREAAEEYVQHEVQQCDMAVERWRSEHAKARRQLNASETARHAMEQKAKRQLQTALQAQEERLLQQQADLVLKERERIKELETQLASSGHDRAHEDSQRTEMLQAQLTRSQQASEELQQQVAGLQQRNKKLQQEIDEQEALIQSWSRAAESLTKRARTSDAAL